MKIYLDYAANTPVDPEVLNVFNTSTLKYYANPNSNHSLGKQSKELIDRASINILQKLNVLNSDIIYTSGASESNNLAIKGLARAYRENGKHIISTCLEHSSVSGTLTFLQNQGYEIDLVDINPDGTVNLQHLNELIRKDTILVSICYLDSELGVLQSIEEIKNIINKYENCYLHVDATQVIGKANFNFNGIDLVTLAPHKFYGLNSCGLLLKNKSLVLEPLINGGTSTSIYRSGTPCLPMVNAIEKSIYLAVDFFKERVKKVELLRDKLIYELKNFPLIRINSTQKSVPFIINVSVKGVKATVMQKELDKEGIFISTKSACSTTSTPSRAVFAITKDRKNALCSWRISLSHLTTEEEIEIFIERFKNIYYQLTKI